MHPAISQHRESIAAICQRYGISRATANRRYDYALTVIVWRLERRLLQQNWSRRYLLGRARVVKADT